MSSCLNCGFILTSENNEEYETESLLSTGAVGSVYRVTRLRDDEPFAMKVIDIQDAGSESESDDDSDDECDCGCEDDCDCYEDCVCGCNDNQNTCPCNHDECECGCGDDCECDSDCGCACDEIYQCDSDCNCDPDCSCSCCNGKPMSKFDRFREEATKMMRLQHPNIVELEDIAVLTSNGVRCGCLFMELAICNLEDLLRGISDDNAEEMAQFVAYQTLDVLSFIHSQDPNGMIHKDIKPANILVYRYGYSGNLVLKLADFGLAKMVHDDDAMDIRGTTEYCAPEVMTGYDNGHGCGYLDRSDIYSLGKVLEVILTGVLGSNGYCGLQGVSNQACKLVRSMTHPTPRNRPNAQSCWRNAWVQQGACADVTDIDELADALDDLDVN